MTSFKRQSSFLFLQKRFRFGLSDDGECHSYLQGSVFLVSIPLKRFRIGLSDDGDCDLSQEYKEPSPYFFRVLLTIIKWLVIDI